MDEALPAKPDPDGIVIDSTPRIGVWIMPDNSSAGALEHFFAKMIRCDDVIWPRSEAYIDGIPEAERKFTPDNPQKIQKAKVHAWLAAEEWPQPMSKAIETGVIDIDVPCGRKLAKWLIRLFR